jgi:WS/DGAT/MGAT family acyltransferase
MIGWPSDRLSSADAAWLHMDRPTNLMVINSVLRFEGRLEPEQLLEVVRERLVEPYPRFSQRVRDGRMPLPGPRWEVDPDFDLARHVHVRSLLSGPGERRLRELLGSLASIPLDRDRPLWEMHLVDGPGRDSTVIVRMHHCIADGVTLAGVMLSLTDPAGRAGAPSRASRRHVPSPDASRTWSLPGVPLAALDTATRTAAAVTRTVVTQAGETLAHPMRLLGVASDLAADGRALSKLALIPPDARNPLRGDMGVERSVAWSRTFPLAEVKAVARAQRATVNDVLLAAVTGALRGYMTSRGQTPRAIRAIVPFNLRPPEQPAAGEQPAPRELGNRFGLVFLTLPVDRASRSERLTELKRRMDAIKRSAEGPVSYALLEAAGLTPPAVENGVIDLFSAKASAVMTNVPGPRETVYLAGVPLRSVLVWAPTSGSVGTSVSIFSYRGTVTIGLLVHADLVPDPQSIVARLHREIAAMAKLAPVAGA